MSKEKAIPTFYALGHLTSDEIWVAPDLPTLISSLIGDPDYLARDPTGRREVRERFLCSLAAEVQAALIQAAVRAETWSWEGASLPETERLTCSRQITDYNGPWKGSLPLILVRPPDAAWTAPTGRVKIVTPATDSALLHSMRELGQLRGAGRLDSSGGIGERGRRA